jgi:hypothetical protein
MNITDLPMTYTEKAVAEQLGVCAETIARERRAGNIRYTFIGKRIRYTAAHIAAYLESRECATTSKPVAASGTSGGPTLLDAHKANQLAREITGKRTPSSPGTS